MKITIAQSLLISLLLHLIIGVFLWFVSRLFDPLSINIVKPVAVSISLPPITQNSQNNKSLKPSSLQQKTNNDSIVASNEIKKDIQYKPQHKEQAKIKQKIIKQAPKLEQKTINKVKPKSPSLASVTNPAPHIAHPSSTAEYTKAIKELDALPPSQIPKPQSKIIAHKQVTKLPSSIISSKKKNILSDQELGVKYASLIGNCIKNKIKLIAVGEPNEFSILVHFYLDRDRKLQGEPSIIITGGDSRQKEIAQNQTMFALKACSPFDLPIDKYDIWKEVIMNFSPNRN